MNRLRVNVPYRLVVAALIFCVIRLQAADLPFSATGENWLKADVQAMEANFAAPPDDCRPGTYWWWQNGGVTRDELARHLRLMKDSGLGIAHIVSIPQPVRPAVSGHPGWLEPGSEPWAEMVAACVEEAGKIGMKVELSPYYGWPLRGPLAPNDLREQMLFRTESVLHGPQTFEGEVPRLAADKETASPENYAHYANRWIRRNKGQPNPTLVAVVLSRPGEAGRVLTQAVSPARRLTVDVPEGDWSLSAFWRMGGYWDILDHYSAEAVRGQLDWAVKPILAKLPRKLVGGTLQALYLDNIEGFYDSAWTVTMLEAFRARRGYDLAQYLPLLFDQKSEVCLEKLVRHPRRKKEEDARNRVVYDYYQTLAELNQEDCWGAMRQWCSEHGLLARGEAHHPTRGDLIDGYGQVDIPEFEAYREHLSVGRGQWVAKFAGHQYGKNVIACESFTWMTPHFRATPRDFREAVDQIFAFGGNRINNHGWSYSPVKAGWPGWFFYASSNLNPNNSWFPCYRALADYKTRMSLLLRCGRPVVDICFYGGGESVGLADCGLEDRTMPVADASEPSGMYDRVSDKVLRTRMEVRDGRLVAGFGQYRLLVLRPEAETMPLETLERLETLVNAGARVVALRLPTRVPGFLDYAAKEKKLAELVKRLFPNTPGEEGRQVGKGHTWLVTPKEMETIVAKMGIQPQVSGAGVDFIHRQGPDFDLFYLYNPSRVQVKAPFSFRATGRPELWDAKTGMIEPVQSLTLEIPGKGSRVVVFRRDKGTTPDQPVEWSAPQTITALAGPWSVRFEHVDGRAAFTKAFDSLVDWITVDELKNFSGGGIYTRQFEMAALPEAAARVFINLGEVRDAAKVRLNGQAVGTVFEAPYRLCVPAGLLKKGLNQVEIAVFNRMENAIVPIWNTNEELRNKIAPANKSEWKVETPVAHPSGLLGPVSVDVQSKKP